MLQVGGLRGDIISSDTVLLSVKKESDRTGAEEMLVQVDMYNHAVFVVKLHIPI